MGFGGKSHWGLGKEDDHELQKATEKRAEADPVFNAMVEAFEEESRKAAKELGRVREANPVGDDLQRKAALQTKIAKNLACISPFANFVYIARHLTGTGLRSLGYFEQIRWEYTKQVRSFVEEKIKDAKKKNPELDEESFLDVSDRSHFVFKEEGLKGKLSEVLPYWGVLGLFNVVFFAAAFAGFMRYDVR
jgi:hypothetical protein